MYEKRGVLIAADEDIVIHSPRDILDALAACTGATGLILTESDLNAAFFDLRSGLAGELFQKFTNYQMHLAIVVPDPAAYGPRFSELAYEHATHGLIRIVGSEAQAVAWLCP